MGLGLSKGEERGYRFVNISDVLACVFVFI